MSAIEGKTAFIGLGDMGAQLARQISARGLDLAVYDVNTIANYDPEIVRLLDAPVGSAFEREGGSGPLVAIEDD